MSFFARRQDSRPSSKARPRAGDSRGRCARRRVRPEAEALDPRLLMAAGAASPDLADRVAQVVQPYLAQGDFPGITVSVVTDGQVSLVQGYGVANEKTGAPVQADTRFDIGSVTKTFTALGVLLLYQESQGTSHPIDLDAPIGDYLQNTRSFKLPGKWSQVTTMELLDMTSGIPDVEDAQPWEAQLKSIARKPLRFLPGTEASYSNSNYLLLGELIEQLSGEKYSTFIQDRILDPLGMSATQELGGSAMVSNQAVGYNAPRNGKWPKAAMWTGTEMYAAAGMVSTAQDMATYMTALLGGRLLDPATYAMMWTATPTPEYGSNPASDDVYGLGWDNAFDTSTGPVEVTKSGQVHGYTSQLILYPSTDSGVFVSFNTNVDSGSDPSGALAYQLAESIYQATKTGSAPGG
jgi:D-alanyl-D-alanine carboxypeptidase